MEGNAYIFSEKDATAVETFSLSRADLVTRADLVRMLTRASSAWESTPVLLSKASSCAEKEANANSHVGENLSAYFADRVATKSTTLEPFPGVFPGGYICSHTCFHMASPASVAPLLRVFKAVREPAATWRAEWRQGGYHTVCCYFRLKNGHT